MPRVPTPQGLRPISTRHIGAGSAAAAAMGREMQAVGQNWTRFFEHQERAEAKREFASSVSALTTELTDLQLEIERNPDLGTVEMAATAWEEGSAEIIGRVGGEIRSSEALDAYTAEATRIAEVKRVSVGRVAYARQKDAARAEMTSGLTAAVASIAAADSDLEREQIRKNALMGLAASDYFSEQEKAALIAVFDQNLERIETELQAKNFARRASDLEIAVSRGDAGEQEIEQAYREGVITATKRTQLVKAIDAQKKRGEETQAQLRLVLEALDGPVVLDPKNTDHKNAVSAYYTLIAPQIMELPPALQNEAKASFAASVGIVPKAVQGEIRGALRSGTDDQAAQAADLYDRLREKNIQTLEDFAAEDIDLAITTQTLIRAGIAPAQAVRDTRERMKRSSQEQEVRERMYSRELLTEPIRDYLEDELGSIWRFDAAVPDAMEGEFGFVARESFLRTGNIEAAREAALELLRQIWGVTEIGRKRWQKYAPEVIYRNGAGTDWIAEQLIVEIAETALQDPEQPLAERLRLEADLLTAREMQPAYTVMLENEAGVLEPIISREGTTLRWQPDWEVSPAKQRLEQERVQELENAKEERRFRLENPHLFSGETQLGIAAVAKRIEGTEAD